MTDPKAGDVATCGLCGHAMPPGEQMFNYHGYSGPCPESPAAPAASEGEDGVVDGVEFFVVPPALNPRTTNLVARFATALAEKLAAAERKYGYSDGWAESDWMDECRAHLAEHVAKGDPRDVAAYCAFLWHHGEPTAMQSTDAPIGEVTGEFRDVGGYTPIITWSCGEHPGVGTELYTRPAAQVAAPAIPPAAVKVSSEALLFGAGLATASDWAIPRGHGVTRIVDERMAYGWNQCREAMLELTAESAAQVAATPKHDEGREAGAWPDDKLRGKLTCLASLLQQLNAQTAAAAVVEAIAAIDAALATQPAARRVTDVASVIGHLPAPITNAEAWPPNYADGWNACAEAAVAGVRESFQEPAAFMARAWTLRTP